MKETTMGERIAMLRRKKQMTQEELAEQLGVSAQAVSKWENNICCPDIALLPKLAQIFGVSTDMLLGAEATSLEDDSKDKEKSKPESTFKSKEKHFRLANYWKIPWAVFVLLLGGSLLWNSLAELGLGFWEICLVDGIIAIGFGAVMARITPFSLGLLALGVVYFLVKFNIIAWADKFNSLILPVLIILFGLSLFYGIFFPKKKRHKINGVDVGKNTEFKADEDEGYLRYSLRFSDNKYVYNGECICGGDINVSFGDAVIDLSGCKTVAENARLYVNISFGDTTILLPKSIRAICDDSGVFESTSINGSADSDALTLYIESKVSFGDLTIKYI